MPRKVPCSNCGNETQLLRIAYGEPFPETEERAKRDEIMLGGCLFSREVALYGCKICKTPLPEYGRHEDRQKALRNEKIGNDFSQ